MKDVVESQFVLAANRIARFIDDSNSELTFVFKENCAIAVFFDSKIAAKYIEDIADKKEYFLFPIR
jgi:hypothetical protein